MKKNKRKKSIFKTILLYSLIVMLIATTGFLYYFSKQLNNLTIRPITEDNAELGINTERNNEIQYNNAEITESVVKQNNGILNIALFGVDSRNSKVDVPHSDCIIIASIDNIHNKIKLSSIMRDTYVKVYKHGKTKITEAYFYGGPKLALRTLNENFNLNIKDYITVDFAGLSRIVDSLGGISINVKKYEVNEINKWIYELSELQKVNYVPIRRSGIQNLSGIQTVAYCRIRQVGDGDFERTNRQRVVLSQIISKVREVGVIKYPSLTAEFMPYVETSISKSEVIMLGGKVLMSGISDIEQQRFPIDGYCKGEVIDKVWYLVPVPNLDTLEKQIQQYIYEDIKPLRKEPLF